MAVLCNLYQVPCGFITAVKLILSNQCGELKSLSTKIRFPALFLTSFTYVFQGCLWRFNISAPSICSWFRSRLTITPLKILRYLDYISSSFNKILLIIVRTTISQCHKHLQLLITHTYPPTFPAPPLNFGKVEGSRKRRKANSWFAKSSWRLISM